MANYNAKGAFVLPRHLQFKDGVNIEAIAANRTLTYKDSQFQRLNASVGALDVILPAEKNGAMFVINCQGNSFTVKDDGGSTIKVLSVGEGGLFACHGTSWKQFI